MGKKEQIKKVIFACLAVSFQDKWGQKNDIWYWLFYSDGAAMDSGMPVDWQRSWMLSICEESFKLYIVLENIL